MQAILQKYAIHYRALVTLGIPIVVGQIGNIVMGFADTLMVGHHSMAELAAASFVNSIFNLFIIAALGFSYGLTPIVGSMYGRGEREGIGCVVRDGLWANTMLPALIMVLLLVLYLNLGRLGQPAELLPLMRTYMFVNLLSIPFVCWFNVFKQFFDAIGHTYVPMCILLGGNVLNIFGNYLLIYGAWGFPEWGLLGAGLSTAFSRVAIAVAAAWVFLKARRYDVYAESFRRSRASGRGFRRVCAMGWPLSLQMGMETAAFSFATVFVGWIGTTALAAHQIVLTVSQVFYMVYYGMASAVRSTSNAGFHLIMLVAVCASVPIFLLRGNIGSWFTPNAEVCLLVAETVVPLIVYQFGDGLQCNFANALRGISHVRPMMLIAFFSYFVVSLPLSWLLGIRMGYGLVGVWFAFPVCLTCAGVLYFACFRREVRREESCEKGNGMLKK